MGMEIFDALFKAGTSSIDDYVKIGQAIGGLLTIITISWKVYGKISNNEEVSFWDDVSVPMIFLMLIIGYTFIFTSIFELTNKIGDSIVNGSSVNQTYEQLKVQFEKSSKAIKFKSNEKYENITNEVNGAGDPTVDLDNIQENTTSIASEVGESLWAMILNGAQQVIYGCAQIARLGVLIIRVIYLTVIFLLGPIAFGLSCFEPFSGSWKTPTYQFINVSLWYPISAILSKIILDIGNVFNKDFAGTGADTMGDMAGIIFAVVIVISHIYIPKMASFLIGQASSGIGTGSAKILNHLKS